MLQKYETRAELDAKARKALDDSDFAYIDKEGDRHLPIHDEAHLRAALGRFGQTQFDSDADKEAAAKKIVAKAKSFGIGISADSDVGKAAGLKEDLEAKGDDSRSRFVPDGLESLTEAERRDAAMSFGDIQSAVYEALLESIDMKDVDYGGLWVEDLGADWVVYQLYGAAKGQDPGLYQQAYAFDANSCVVFAGDPVRVDRKTSFVPVQLNAADTVGERRKVVDDYQPQAYHADPDETVTCPSCGKQDDVDAKFCDQCGFKLEGADGVKVGAPEPEKKSLRADAGNCPTCEGSGKIRDGNVTCPDCKGTGKAPAETKSRIPGRRGPRVPRHQRRSLDRLPEVRRVQTNFEVRASSDGSDIVLAGTPIVYDTPYSVRDMLGSFRETMKPGVAAEAMGRADFDTRFLVNHDGLPLARTASGTLVLTDTPTGLRAEAHLDGRSQMANDLAVSVERGDVSQMSCGFVVADDEWRWGADGEEERDIFSFDDLFDVSAVTYPASPTTSIEVAQRMLAMAGQESRERIRRLFEVGAAVRSGAALAQKDGEALRAAAEALYRIEGAGVPLTVQLDALRHANTALYAAFRSGKVLSAENQEDFETALEALHSCDDIDIPEITRSLETIDKALDAGQAALSSVLGRANPDGDKGDKNPTLVDAKDPASDKDARGRQRAALELIRARELLAS